MKPLYVTVTINCTDLATATFPNGCEWELTNEDYNDDGSCVVRYEWNGEMQTVVERNLNSNPEVISYQILD